MWCMNYRGINFTRDKHVDWYVFLSCCDLGIPSNIGCVGSLLKVPRWKPGVKCFW